MPRVEDILALAEKKGRPLFILILDGIEDPHNLGTALYKFGTLFPVWRWTKSVLLINIRTGYQFLFCRGLSRESQEMMQNGIMKISFNSLF